MCYKLTPNPSVLHHNFYYLIYWLWLQWLPRHTIFLLGSKCVEVDFNLLWQSKPRAILLSLKHLHQINSVRNEVKIETVKQCHLASIRVDEGLPCNI